MNDSSDEKFADRPESHRQLSGGDLVIGGNSHFQCNLHGGPWSAPSAGRVDVSFHQLSGLFSLVEARHLQ
jgi:hypothetical protein